VSGSEGRAWYESPVLEGIEVVDLTDESGALAARILADLGAHVTRVERPTGDPLRLQPFRHAAWTARSEIVCLAVDDPALDELLATADVVLGTSGHGVEPDRAPDAVWVNISPFGLIGPRCSWRASDLGVMAATGNLYATGDPDRPPVRCAEPIAYAHAGPEAAFAALTALATGCPQQVDLSIQEAVMVASMGAAGRFIREKARGQRRGASIGRTREIWPCADGFVSFGLRGGKARIPSLETLSGLIGDPVLTERDWSTFSVNTASDEDLAAIEAAVGGWFATRTMGELYAIACETNLMLAPINSPKELLASEQLAARDILGPVGDLATAPTRFVHVHPHRSGGEQVSPETPARLQNELGEVGRGAWHGTRILEFGAGAAGPIATRYFAEHGADVIRVESRTRPDFLRTYGPAEGDDRLERSPLFDALNPGKRSVAIDLKHPSGRELAIELVKRADAVAENFAPRAMRGLGLAYDDLVEHKPDLVMISACLNGQTGPHRDYPGFGGQGSALAGFNFLTGWPDREPVGPFATITDSLAPRFSATALAAAILHHRRTGEGTYLDLSQVEAGVFALSPWIVDYALTGRATSRMGNRSPRAVPHGLFPCAGDDRWIALATWDDEEWAVLATEAGVDDPDLASEAGRLERVDTVEAKLTAWTRDQDATTLAERLQALGVEAVPVADFGDAHVDPQLRSRQHYVCLEHPVLGPGDYERNGFRVSGAPSGYDTAAPLLGQHTDEVLAEVLGLTDSELASFRQDGAIQ
jgi:crotonobetainyl-CoA:carnitine CoA-transferase CaiB-like acyl-CoA transferase